MRCGNCHGTGQVAGTADERSAVAAIHLPCPECGGCGIAHCCDGITACNDACEPDTVPALAEHPPGPRHFGPAGPAQRRPRETL